MDEQQQPGRAREPSRGALAVLSWALPVVVAVLLVVTTVALAVSRATDLPSDKLSVPDLGTLFGILVAAATVIGLILWVVVLATGENAKGAPPKRRRGRFITQLVLLGAVVAFLYFRGKEDPAATPPTPVATDQAVPGAPTSVATAAPPPPPASGGSGLFILIVLAAVAVAAILAGLILARRVRQLDEYEEAEPDAAGDLAAAVSAAERASFRDNDPRMVIIGCYEALEGALSSRGVVRGRAETATTVLGTAANAGLLSPSGAREADLLVDLFERARFSPHEVGEDDVAAARRHLAALRQDIEARRRVMREAEAAAAESEGATSVISQGSERR